MCQLVAPHLGYEPLPTPQWLQAKFDEGSLLESDVLDMLMKDGWLINAYQDEVNDIGDYQHEFYLEVIPGQAVIRGHLDAKGKKASSTNGWWVIEVKTMADDSWRAFHDKGWDVDTPLMDKYRWQVSCYMLGTGLPCMLVAYNKATGELARQTVNEPFYSMSDIARRIKEAEDAISLGIVPDNCSDYPCPYVYLHGDRVTPEKAEPELDGLLSAWHQADIKAKVYEKEKAVLKEAITEMVGEIEGAVRGSQGVKVNRYWQRPETREVKYSGKWVTKVEGPRRNG